MIAITALAALIVRVIILIQVSWFIFENLKIYMLSQERGPDAYAEFYPEPIILLFPLLIWLTLFIWAPSICRALAGRHKDASVDLSLNGADLFRLAALCAAIGLLLPAADQLRDVFIGEFHVGWYLGSLIGAALGVFFLAISLMTDPVARTLSNAISRLRGRPGTQTASERGGREPS